jgi:outer membrane lipoprotein-sorting protein
VGKERVEMIAKRMGLWKNRIQREAIQMQNRRTVFSLTIQWIMPCLLLVLFVGCAKNPDAPADIHTALKNRVATMKGYTATGVMSFYSGINPVRYDVEVAYKKPDSYRVSLKNELEKVNQVILKNKQGVYILTPSLKKSYRFQTNWPKNQGQIYLYQSIVESLIQAKPRDGQKSVFKDSVVLTKQGYIFTVPATYPNASFQKQKVWISRKTLAPTRVDVFDVHHQKKVGMTFSRFQFNPTFDADYFTQKRSLEVYEWTP